MSIFLIDLGKPVMFVHVPKTGGTSIRRGRQLEGPEMFKPKKEWTIYPSFAVVRNPYDRIESCWRDFRFQRKMTKLNFKDFILKFRCNGGDVADPRTIEHHMAPMSHPVHGLAYATDIGRFETLQEDFDAFCLKYGLSHFILAHERSSSGTPRCVWNSEVQILIDKFYRKDFTL